MKHLVYHTIFTLMNRNGISLTGWKSDHQSVKIMKRRNFIKKSAITAAVAVTPIFFSGLVNAANNGANRSGSGSGSGSSSVSEQPPSSFPKCETGTCGGGLSEGALLTCPADCGSGAYIATCKAHYVDWWLFGYWDLTVVSCERAF